MRLGLVLVASLALGTWASRARSQPEPPPDAPAPGEEAAEGEEAPAELPPDPVPGEAPDEDAEPEPPLTPPAQDSLGGHFVASAAALWAIPFGAVEEGFDQSDFMSAGPGLGLELAYGVSRTVAVGAWGQALFLDGSDDCSSCSTRSLAGGLFVRYHLVQGVRFDPWMSAGLGFRTTSIDPGLAGQPETSYSGVEWLRLAVGGDWYAFQNFGFGPYFELDLGRYSSKSRGDFGSAANHWHFITGARVTFDVPGK